MMKTVEDMETRVAELESMLESEKAKNSKNVQLKVSIKGAVQINNIRRFPITLYKKEMNIILDNSGMIMEFMRVHDDELK
jgi:hypothetical protein